MNSVSIDGSAESVFPVMSVNLHSNCDVLCEGPVKSGLLPGGGMEGGHGLVFWLVLIITLHHLKNGPLKMSVKYFLHYIS